MKKQFVSTFTITLSGGLSDQQLKIAREALNVAYVNDKEVNEYNEQNMMVGKYDDHPNFKKLQDSHVSLARSWYKCRAEVGVDLSGKLHLIKLIEEK